MTMSTFQPTPPLRKGSPRVAPAKRAGGGVDAAGTRRGRPPAAPPRLRLVGSDEAVKPQVGTPPQTPLVGSMDARWVLAVRVAEHLQGSILPPQARDRLVRLGKSMGLTPFDANLIIAIVQDQARRGYAPAYCPTASEPQLRMVPPPQPKKWLTPRGVFLVAGILVGLITLELILLSRVF